MPSATESSSALLVYIPKHHTNLRVRSLKLFCLRNYRYSLAACMCVCVSVCVCVCGGGNPLPRQQNLDSFKLKKFAENNLKLMMVESSPNG